MIYLKWTSASTFWFYTGTPHHKKLCDKVSCHWSDVSDKSMLKFGECPVKHGTTVVGISATMMQMMHKYCFLDQGYQLYTDNFYSSLHLAFALLQRSTGFCGTVHINQKLWLVALNKASRKTGKQIEEIKSKKIAVRTMNSRPWPSGTGRCSTCCQASTMQQNQRYMCQVKACGNGTQMPF